MKIQESAENYLETILILSERSKLLSDWLTYLGVPKDIATEDACRIEHVISQESFEKIRAHVREMNEHL